MLGDHASDISEGLQQPLIPLLPEGQLPAGDPVGRQVAMHLLLNLFRGPLPIRSRATVVLPRDPEDHDDSARFFTRVLGLLNCESTLLAAPLAVLLAELGQDQFSGVSLTFGAGQLAACVARRGIVLAQVQVPFGGDWIDFQLAESLGHFRWDTDGHRYLDLASAGRWKSSPDRSLMNVKSEADETLRELYVKSLDELCRALAAEVESASVAAMLDTTLPLVCHGGGTQIGGFVELLLDRWKRIGVDLPVSTIRRSTHGDWAVARGCLIHQELEVIRPRVPSAA
ncbi:MAG: hypothetical protein R3B90_09120 [Planctomycetaceae bacterium]